MTEKLKPVNYDDTLSEFDLSLTAPCDDRLMTELRLCDYDWMQYVFKTCLPTKSQGFLRVEIKYFGCKDSTMVVCQNLNPHKGGQKAETGEPEIYIHKMQFDTDIFVEFLKKYMSAHIAQWDSTYAFCGEKMAVEIFNKILENSRDYQITKKGEARPGDEDAEDV